MNEPDPYTEARIESMKRQADFYDKQAKRYGELADEAGVLIVALIAAPVVLAFGGTFWLCVAAAVKWLLF